MSNTLATIVFLAAVAALFLWRKRLTATNRATPRLGGGGGDDAGQDPTKAQNVQ